jgi:hypothetical protein
MTACRQPAGRDTPSFRGGANSRADRPKSDFKGLAWDQQENAWRVRISTHGKQVHVGRCGRGSSGGTRAGHGRVRMQI